jgi:hypothetical protein
MNNPWSLGFLCQLIQKYWMENIGTWSALISIHFFGLIVYEAHLLSLSNVSSKFVVDHANGAIVYIPNENSRNRWWGSRWLEETGTREKHSPSVHDWTRFQQHFTSTYSLPSAATLAWFILYAFIRFMNIANNLLPNNNQSINFYTFLRSNCYNIMW